jgi:hypothetical protein
MATDATENINFRYGLKTVDKQLEGYPGVRFNTHELETCIIPGQELIELRTRKSLQLHT